MSYGQYGEPPPPYGNQSGPAYPPPQQGYPHPHVNPYPQNLGGGYSQYPQQQMGYGQPGYGPPQGQYPYGYGQQTVVYSQPQTVQQPDRGRDKDHTTECCLLAALALLCCCCLMD